MIGGVIVTHGQLANELVSAAEMIVGEINHITAVSIGWHDDVDVAREEIDRAIQRLDTGSGVLLLTDMFGGTPTNIAASFLDRAPVEVVTGVNLPMVIKLATQEKDETLPELARRVRDQGRNKRMFGFQIERPRIKAVKVTFTNSSEA
jgi:mannose PTS system EIIA component